MKRHQAIRWFDFPESLEEVVSFPPDRFICHSCRKDIGLHTVVKTAANGTEIEMPSWVSNFVLVLPPSPWYKANSELELYCSDCWMMVEAAEKS